MLAHPAPSPGLVPPTDTGLAFLMRSGEGSAPSADDHRKPAVLEVAGLWSDTIVDVQHVRRGERPVTAGSATGLRWRLLGLPVAWVPSNFAKVAWMLAPMLSETTEEWTSDFFIPSDRLPSDQFELFTCENGQFVAHFSEEWDGFVDFDGERILFEELIASGRAEPTGAGMYAFPIEEGARLVADLGDVTVMGHLVPDSAGLRTRPGADIDPVFAGVTGMFTCVFAMLLGVLWTSPPPPDSTVAVLEERVASLVLQRPTPPPVEAARTNDSQEHNPGAKAKKAEGTVGKRDAKQTRAKGTKVAQSKKQLDQQIATSAGVLGVFNDDSALSGMLGQSALAADFNTGIGGALGAKGVQLGSGGMGSRGGGLGGGGSADGFGGLSTKGRGSGRDGFGENGGQFTKKGTGSLGRIDGSPIILGALDKSLIDQVVRRHMNQLRYCYQRELTKNPDLGGKITIKFVIDREGQVSTAKVKSSTMGNAAVESCMTSRFQRFTFPKPKGNGVVIVSYPFLFSPG